MERWQNIHLIADATTPPYNPALVPSRSPPPSTYALLASGDCRCGSFLVTKPALEVALLSQPGACPSWAIEWQHLIYPLLCQEAAQSTFPAAGGASDLRSPLGCPWGTAQFRIADLVKVVQDGGNTSNGKPPQEITPCNTFELTETQKEKNTKLWVNFGPSHQQIMTHQ